MHALSEDGNEALLREWKVLGLLEVHLVLLALLRSELGLELFRRGLELNPTYAQLYHAAAKLEAKVGARAAPAA